MARREYPGKGYAHLTANRHPLGSKRPFQLLPGPLHQQEQIRHFLGMQVL